MGDEAGDQGSYEPSDEDYTIAEQTANEAVRLHAQKEYARSIELFVTAFEYVPSALFLVSAARASYDAGTWSQSKRLCMRALEVEGEGMRLEDDERERVEKMIIELDAKIAAELAKTGEWSWVGYTGAGLVALGASSMVGTLVISAGVDARRDELASSTTKPEYDALYAELSGQQQLGQGLLYAGAGLAIAGGALIAWDLLTPGGVPYETPQVALELGPEKTSIQVGWRW